MRERTNEQLLKIGRKDIDRFCATKCKSWLDHCGVSAHYIIDREGCIRQTVLEKHMAWHAGNSKMPFECDARSDVNQFSIGIEILASENSGIETSQYESLAWLIEDIAARYDLAAIVSHKEIAPGRKTDPWSFNVERLEGALAPLIARGLVRSEVVVKI